MDEINRIKKSVGEKRFLNKLFVGLMAFVEFIIFCIILYILIQLIKGPGEELYNLVALGILLIWFGILIGYYAWAVYFYNINFGLTNEDWAEIREKRLLNPEGIDAPDKNPNEEQTFGLPVGTVRGSLALTLMVGGISMTIAAFGMDNVIEENAFLVDNFEFFKTAFLMMIAFYFGNKSLELMGYKSKKVLSGNQDSSKEKTGTVPKIPVPPPPTQDASVAKEILQKETTYQSTPDNQVPSGKNDNDFDIPGAIQ